jgi:hypothetical protein
MDGNQIQVFENSLIAFYRPRKRTYFFLQWLQDRRVWAKYTGDQRVFTLHQSSSHNAAGCTIVFANNYGRGRQKSMRIACRGFFLKSGTEFVPLVDIHGTIPQCMVGTEFTATAPENNDEYRVAQQLWRLAPPPPAPAPQPRAPPPRQLIVVKRKAPIPRRIAWLVAEDAQKQGETCAITMEDISPITAAVTTCFHVFQADALDEWVQRHRTEEIIPCPVCRKNFAMTRAFDPGVATIPGSVGENPVTVG